MERNEFEIICETIDHLLQSEHLAAINNQDVQKIKEICEQARGVAENGEYEESHRLIQMARDIEVELAERLGRGGIKE